MLVPFREPRNPVDVLLLPFIVMTSGTLWVQLGAWFAPPASRTERGAPSVFIPLGALLIVLTLFQLVLRPGVRFY